ncbi:transposase [Ferrithrix thermotolerans]|uniref:transposase n=1 Tax=Ferrithrix thermotolerans TaxID=209649 RepID=UPI00093491EE
MNSLSVLRAHRPTSTKRSLRVHVVLDNYLSHKTESVRTWLLAHPRFVFHFTPTYSSWMNQVERWFAALTPVERHR